VGAKLVPVSLKGEGLITGIGRHRGDQPFAPVTRNIGKRLRCLGGRQIGAKPPERSPIFGGVAQDRHPLGAGDRLRRAEGAIFIAADDVVAAGKLNLCCTPASHFHILVGGRSRRAGYGKGDSRQLFQGL